MGIYDRTYYESPTAQYATGGGGQGGWNWRSVCGLLLIANTAIFFLSAMKPLGDLILGVGLMQAEAVLYGQVWRLLTATYLHANLFHLFVNMLGLYFFGPALERVWGARQFLFVYTLGGVAGNVLLTLAGLVHFIPPQVPGLGASGSVLSLLGACAVLFPRAEIYLYFLFPIQIRTFVLLYGLWFVINIFTQGRNYGGDICHVGGLLVGLAWAYTGGISLSGRHHVRAQLGALRDLFSVRPRAAAPGTWQRRMAQRQADEELIDRLLAKVQAEGLDSLTTAERHALEAATRRRRAEEARIDSFTRT
ncbi:MAG: rhomboid family intramembrane serine protease [Phycisphaerales bacterium]|nr:rhomboid family intramembrane serine protease [Phycisphaerales bacterium]